MNKKLPFNRIWLLIAGTFLSALIIGFGNAQYQKEINKPIDNQKQELIENEIVSDTKIETVNQPEQKNDSSTHKHINSSTTNSSDSVDIADTVDITNSDNSNVNIDNSADNDNINVPSQEQKKTETVILDIKSIGIYETGYQEGDMGWDIMKRAAAKYYFPMKYQTYDFGIYISGIGGIEPEYGSYWALYHNGQYSIVGIRDLNISPNDIITWQVESWQ